MNRICIAFTLAFYLTTFSSFGQATLGIGLVTINFDKADTFFFYKNPSDTAANKSIEIIEDQSSWTIRNSDKQVQWLNPEALSIDNGFLIFRCKSIRKEWYEVVVNNKTGQSYWIKQSGLMRYSNWCDFLKGMFGVERASDFRQKLCKEPIDNSDEIKYDGSDCFQVRSCNGDWIEIFTPEYCKEGYTDSKTIIESAWIKWRQGDNLLVTYFIDD